jgi:hypothetical protein
MFIYIRTVLISRKKLTQGIEAPIARVIQSNRSYRGITCQFNVSKGTISNLMKFLCFWCCATIPIISTGYSFHSLPYSGFEPETFGFQFSIVTSKKNYKKVCIAKYASFLKF